MIVGDGLTAALYRADRVGESVKVAMRPSGEEEAVAEPVRPTGPTSEKSDENDAVADRDPRGDAVSLDCRGTDDTGVAHGGGAEVAGRAELLNADLDPVGDGVGALGPVG